MLLWELIKLTSELVGVDQVDLAAGQQNRGSPLEGCTVWRVRIMLACHASLVCVWGHLRR